MRRVSLGSLTKGKQNHVGGSVSSAMGLATDCKLMEVIVAVSMVSLKVLASKQVGGSKAGKNCLENVLASESQGAGEIS